MEGRYIPRMEMGIATPNEEPRISLLGFPSTAAEAAMKTQTIVSVCIALLVSSNVAYGENKKGQLKLDEEKKEATYTTNKAGDWQVGASQLPKKPEELQTPKGKMEEQQEKGGQVFIRKKF